MREQHVSTPGEDRPSGTSTFLVADLAGYTALTQAHGDEHAADVACAFADAVRVLAEPYDADNVKTIGDAVLLRVPDPVDAIRVAARIVGELGARDRSLGVCVGMDTGTAVERAGDLFGSAVNVASRVADLAASGEVLMTGATRDAVAGAVLPGQLQARGEHRFKNLPEPLSVFALVAAGDEAAQMLPVDPVCRMAIDPGRVVERVNEKRAAEGRMLLPARVTPHTLRRTYASLCFFAGRDLRWVMGQLGHDDPRMTLGVYAQCMKRSQIDEAVVWELMRFPDEAEERSRDRSFGPTNGPTRLSRFRS